MRRSVARAASLVVVALTIAVRARADGPPPTRAACIEASLKAQEQRAAGHSAEARVSLAVCGHGACPAIIRHDCNAWMAEMNASAPSVVLGAQDGEGQDILDARVLVDGVDVTAHADGRAMPLDPGPHLVRYERPDGTAAVKQFLVREGETDRPLIVKFPPAPPKRPLTTVPVPRATPTPVLEEGGQPDLIAGVVLGGAGLALVGVGAAFVVAESSKTSALDTMCAAGACRQGTQNYGGLSSQVATVNTERAIAGISFGMAAAAISAGVYFLVAQPIHRGRQGRSDSRGRLFVLPAPRGGAFGYTLAF